MTPTGIKSIDDAFQKQNPWIYDYGSVVFNRIVDGDTAYFDITRTSILNVDMGFRINQTITSVAGTTIDIRLLGINAPPLTDSKGQDASDALTGMLSIPETLKLYVFKPDKYGGRWLGVLFAKNKGGTEVCVNAEMINQGFAAEYNGHGVKVLG